MKKIIIIDCFITNKDSEDILLKTLSSFKDNDILLVTNKSVSHDIQSKINFLLYDSRNQLFEKTDYDYTKHNWNFWKDCGDFTSYNFYLAKQPHGLSVIVNLLNALNLSKSLGYTHFQYIQYDTEYSEESLNWMNEVPNICENLNKKGLVYYNVDKLEDLELNPDMANDMNVSYIFCEIEYFLSKIPKINNEEEYRNLIVDEFGYLRFIVVEKYIFHFFRKNGDSDLIIKTQIDYKFDFNGNNEALKTSSNNFPKEYKGCPTRITKIKNSDKLTVFSHNYTNDLIFRKIRIFKNSDYYDMYSELKSNNWSYFLIENDIDKIEVYDSTNDEYLYTEINDDKVVNYLDFDK
jgi:hypothetical protein